MAAIIQHAQCATYPQASHGTCMEVRNTFAKYTGVYTIDTLGFMCTQYAQMLST